MSGVKAALQHITSGPRSLVPIIMESPYAARDKLSVEDHVRYGRLCLKDCLNRGEAPIASHLLYTQPGILDDSDPDQRLLAIEAGLAWGRFATKTVVYIDLGISRGMLYGMDRARMEMRPLEQRTLPSDLFAEFRNP